MSYFEPIAIIGQSCVLPGALDPQALWEAVIERRDLTSSAPAGYWQLPADRVRAQPSGEAQDRTWSDQGGYVQGFDAIFDPQGFAVPAELIQRLDPLFAWVLHGCREALRSSGLPTPPAGSGLVLGNLAYPTPAMTRYAASVWLGETLRSDAGIGETDPHNRFCSGWPAHLAAQALGLDGRAFALDAACASSLYAIKLACDQLQDRQADLMLAGAVNHADDLFIHVGFCALQAMSKSGRSRPFEQDADGLVPGEGAAFVALERLEDARAKGRSILGVIRGIGLSNDGRSGGFLAPAADGQLRAMRSAYEMSDIDPTAISLLECHATGTPVGDAVELNSAATLFSGASDLPLGSLKANLGHLISVAGAAGLIKLLGALEHGVLPPSRTVDQPLEALGGKPLRLLQRPEEWDGPRRAGLSAFGFGGNNAHLIVESADADVTRTLVAAPSRPEVKVAIVALEIERGDLTEVTLDANGLRFPPVDLAQTLPQQLMILELARRVSARVQLPENRTAVLIGIGCDPEICRYAARWRLPVWAEAWGPAPPEWVETARDQFIQGLQAAGVVGTMPNIPANRINAQLDLAGPSFTISSEELSGVRALELAERALRHHEIDAALVGAVDFSREPVHRTAAESVLGDGAAEDAGVLLVLKRLEDAWRDDDPILATLTPGGQISWTEPASERAHAAWGLLQVADATIELHNDVRLSPQQRSTTLELTALGGQSSCVGLAQGPDRPRLLTPEMRVYSGADAAEIIRALAEDRRGENGPARLVLTQPDADAAAHTFLASNPSPELTRIGSGAYWCGAPITGELGFVFTGAAAAYPGMGRELLRAHPELGHETIARFPALAAAEGWLDPNAAGLLADPLAVLLGCTLLSQVHARLTGTLLGLRPDAVLGVSSGETNSMFATGAWRDLDGLFSGIEQSGMYTEQIAGECQAARNAWGADCPEPLDWRCWRLLIDADRVTEVVAGEPFVRLTMVNAPADCVIAGQAEDCRRVIETLGRSRALPLGHDIVAHCPELGTWRDEWRALHHRQTETVAGIRYYSNAAGGSYIPTPDSVADALTDQQTDRVDFRNVIQAAWRDGVRIFVEHGPRNLCTGWISQTLGDREHLCLALDRSGAGIEHLLETVAMLVAAGQNIQWRTLFMDAAPNPSKALRFPAHPEPVSLPPLPESGPESGPRIQHMTPPPLLPPVLSRTKKLTEPVSATTREPAPAPVSPAVTPPTPSAAVATPSPPPQRTGNGRSTAPAGSAVHIATNLRAFHEQVATAHRLFLAQQERAAQHLLGLGSTTPPTTVPPTTGPTAPRPTTPAPAVAAPQPSVPAAQPPTPPPTAKPHAERAEASPQLPRDLPGPTYDRAQLEVLASGKISEVLGPLFTQQDDFRRQVRMPEPPLLLADRVTGIDAAAGSMGKGTIWTETDIGADAWYLQQGRMPAGIMIESGQADLLLISWLGVDFQNRGERVYRLLGCELTYHGTLPEVGDRLDYEIHLDGYAQQGPIQLMFFHYDCHVEGQLRLSVRGGQAGFFSDEELAGSAGILWDPATGECREQVRLDPPSITCLHRGFDKRQVEAFTEGRLASCFGPEFRLASCHVRSPRIAGGRMQLFDEVSLFDPRGGPWQRGYLRAEKQLSDEEWFYDGHFKNDPCMPGTLMLEGCLQTMAFYIAALGYTVQRDGWRFQPVPEQTYKLRCRGQVIPGARDLVYEVFVEEVVDGPIPLLVADLLCTVDGLAAFHCRGMQLSLVPDFPLESRSRLMPPIDQSAVFDFRSLAACAWGRPSDAFGPMYRVFDTHRRCPRLPGPPYHFISRVARLDAEAETRQSGGVVEVEYDIPPDAWYFAENGNRSMPFCVLLEAALQPCGWLASYVGCALSSDEDVFFRNLDGTGTQHVEVLADAGTLVTKVTSTGISKAGPMTIVSFEVECHIGETRVYTMDTVFGFFPEAALASQVGLPASEEEIARLTEPSEFSLDLRHRPEQYFNRALRLPGPMLMLLDRISGWWPEQRRLRAEIDVDPDQWFFKCHFMGDPVQPGSLGIEAMLQLLQFHMLHQGMDQGIEDPRFEPILLEQPMTWRYRGQVLPKNSRVIVELVLEDEGPHHAIGKAWLWVDGMRIYEAVQIGMRVTPDRAQLRAGEDEVLDPTVDRWLGDHRPTWTVPALAMMSMVDRLAQGALTRAPGQVVIGLRNVRVHRWLGFSEGPQALKVHGVPRGPDRVECQLLVWEEERYHTVASGEVIVGEHYPLGQRPAQAPELQEQPDPYEAGRLFHGPAYQALTALFSGPGAASTRLDATSTGVPIGALNQRLLDAATHGIPHDNLHAWDSQIGPEQVAYPVLIPTATFHRPVPTAGEVRCEARFAGFHGGRQFPKIALTLIHADSVWAEITLVESLFPKGPLGVPEPQTRRAFLRDREYVPGLGLSHQEDGTTVLTEEVVARSNWLDGSLAKAYDASSEDLTRELAIKEHVARQAQVHPAWVTPDGSCSATPYNRYSVVARPAESGWRVNNVSPMSLDLTAARDHWRERLSTGPWIGEDLLLGLAQRFVRSVNLSDPPAFQALSQRGAIFLANHQVGVESVLFSILSAGLLGVPTAVLAKQEHSNSWIGRMLANLFARPNIENPSLLALVDRDDQQQMLATLNSLFRRVAEGGRSLLIHVEGTRSLQCRQPVEVVSTTAIDLAVKTGAPIVPVRFSGGLPIEPLKQRVEFPIGFGRQDYLIGAPLGGLEGLTSTERKQHVLEALNRLGGTREFETPHPGDPVFAQQIESGGGSSTHVVLREVLSQLSDPCEETRAWLQQDEPAFD